MRHLGLTGGIGTGKSTVAAMLAELGAVVVDADVLAHEALAAGTGTARAVADRFPSVVDGRGKIDRARLAAQIFAGADARRDLEALLHPVVRRRAAEIVDALRSTDSVVVEVIPLLFETAQGPFDRILVTDCDPEVALGRAVVRGMTQDDARARQAAQMRREDRLARADIVIDTSGSIDDLRSRVSELWVRLLAG